MMRPQSLVMPPWAPELLSPPIVSGNSVVITWNDRSLSETTWVVQRNNGAGWASLKTIPSTTAATANTAMSYSDKGAKNGIFQYRVVAQNTVGYGGEYPSLTAESFSNVVPYGLPAAPTALSTTILSAAQVRLNWTDNSNNETGFTIQRDGVTIATVGANVRTFTDSVIAGQTYTYSVAAVNAAGSSSAAMVTVTVSAPAAPTLVTAVGVRQGNNNNITLTLTNVANAVTYTVQRSTDAGFTAVTTVSGITGSPYTNSAPRGTPGVTTYWYRAQAVNPLGSSTFSNALSVVTK